jgi:hypothetical protein
LDVDFHQDIGLRLCSRDQNFIRPNTSREFRLRYLNRGQPVDAAYRFAYQAGHPRERRNDGPRDEARARGRRPATSDRLVDLTRNESMSSKYELFEALSFRIARPYCTLDKFLSLQIPNSARGFIEKSTCL